MHCMLCMSTMLTQVFVTFTQPCIQCNCTHVKGIKSVLCIQGPLAHPGRKAHCSHQSSSLAVHQSEETAYLTFWDLSTTKVIAGKKTKN